MIALRRPLENLGHAVFELLESAYEGAHLVAVTAKGMVTRPLYPALIVEQFHALIVKSAPLVLITAASTGAVMAMQFGQGMTRFGGKLYVPTVVGLAIVRALGPVFTSLMLAARVGAGVAAELGSMTVTQQVDAVRALGTDPIRKLVVPRIIALAIGAPLLTLLADLFGILGGLAAATTSLQISPALYIQKTYDAIRVVDLFAGTVKTIFFGVGIGFIASYIGLRTRDGTIGIGNSTTRTVVTCSIFVMITDVLFTKLAWILQW